MKVKGKYGVFFFLFIPLFFTAAILLTDYLYIREQMVSAATEIAGETTKNIVSETERELSGMRSTVDNFLSPFVYKFRYVNPSNPDDTFLFPTAKRSDLKRYKKADVLSTLEGLAVSNPQLQSVSGIYYKGILADNDNEDYFPLVYSGSLRSKNLVRENDVDITHLLERSHKSKASFFSAPKFIEKDSIMICTYVQPVFDFDDTSKLNWQVLVDINLERLNEIIVRECIYDQSSVFLFDSSMNIVAHNDKEYLGMNVRDVLRLHPNFDSAVTEDFIEQHTGENLRTATERMWENDKYLMYVYPVPKLKMLMLVMLPKEEVFASLRNVYAKMIISVMVMMIILLLCAFAVFHFYVKKDRREAKTNHELEIAEAVQKGFLPGNSLQIGGLELYAVTHPAEMVGGDFYEYVRKDDRLFFCLGDVSGKGIPASIFMSMCSILFRTAVRLSDDAAQITEIINETLAERNDEFMFCTCFIGVIDLNSGVIDYCNAGHNPPIAVGGGKDIHFLPVVPNRPLGLVKGEPFEKESGILEQGQSLFIYSDGVTEARCPESTFKHDSFLFGENRLLEILSAATASNDTPKGLVNAVFAAVNTFAAGAPQSDDITMLCIRRG